MAAWVVVDSGVFLVVTLEETYSDKAEALIQHWHDAGMIMAAPQLFEGCAWR